MSFSIHHGPNGSYKTFSVVQRFIIKALYEGRCVVTNIRGMGTIENIEKAFNKSLPPMAELIFVDWEDPDKPDNLDLLARWFHWIPFGALFVLDECHNFYPEDTKVFLKQLDYFNKDMSCFIEPMGGISLISPVTGKEIHRPKDILNAFRMHRHFLWDIFFTTPDIDFVPKKIRLSAEFCYRHRDLSGLVPWKKGMWKEVQHSARTNGDSVSSALNSEEFKRDKRIFECYSSTATGTYQESMASKSVFTGGKIKIVFGIWLISLCVTFFMFYSKMAESEDIQAGGKVSLSGVDKNSNKVGHSSSDNVSNKSVDEKLHTDGGTLSYPLPFDADKLYIKGSIHFNDTDDYQYIFVSVKDGQERIIFQSSLEEMGYKLFAHKASSVVVRKVGQVATYKADMLQAGSKQFSDRKVSGFSAFSSSGTRERKQLASVETQKSNNVSISGLSVSGPFSRFRQSVIQ